MVDVLNRLDLLPPKPAIEPDELERWLYENFLRVQAGKVAWRFGGWGSKNTYYRGDMVRDGRWTMVARQETRERPAPQPIGDPFFLYQGAGLIDTSVLAKQIIYGTRITVQLAGYFLAYRLNVTSGDTYTLFLVDDPLGAVNITEIINFTASTTGWLDINVPAVIVFQGQMFDIFVIAQEKDATPITFNGNWNYTKPNNDGTPSSGNVLHSARENGLMQVHYTDNDGGNRQAELQALTIGDTITRNAFDWLIQSMTDQGAYITFGVSPAIQGADTGVSNFIFETVTPTPIPYGADNDYWLTSQYTAQGLFGADISYTNIVPDDTMYGVDILIQRALVSSDWEAAAYSGIGSNSDVPAETLAFLPPVAQMVSTVVSEVLSPGDIVAPFEIQWGRDIITDKVNGTMVIPLNGVYNFSFDISGTAAAANSEQIFSIRADGVVIAIIESVQKQSQEGVQAALIAHLRLFAGQVIDVQMTGDSNMTAEHIVFSLAYFSSLLNIVES